MNGSKKRLTTAVVWIALVLAFFCLFSLMQSGRSDRLEGFATFLNDLDEGRVEEVRIDNNRLWVTLGSGQKYSTLGLLDARLGARLAAEGVPVLAGKESGWWDSSLSFWVLIVVVAVLVLYLVRRSRGNMGDILSLRKTRARLIPEVSKVTFDDVGGCEEAKEMLGDLIDFLKKPGRWTQAGVRLPRGVLLEGPPGCGKTLLARAVAGETNASFYLVSASEFVEMFVGVGAARVRDTFETARKKAPAVIFIDELDAVGRRRGSGIGSSHDEREQTLNQLLVCLDGFESREPVVVIAATNRPDILDSALLRPGRFDRRIRVPSLSREARLHTLRIHTKNKNLAPDVSLESLADGTEGFSGAQLESLANEAAVLAVRRMRHLDGQPATVHREDFDQALKPTVGQAKFFNRVDSLLVESASQLAEPTGKARVRVALDGDRCIEGELIWADGTFLKIRGESSDAVVPKAQVRRIEALDGTERVDASDVLPDRWRSRFPGTM